MNIIDKIGLTKKITRPRSEAFLRRYASSGLTLDIGCGNDSYRSIFPNMKTLEINPRGKVDYKANAEDMPEVPSDRFDVVLLSGVAEHMENPKAALDEIYRILKPGGLLIFNVPFIYPLHDYPGDYWRFTDQGVRKILYRFEIQEMEAQSTTMETFAILFQRVGFQCDTVGGRFMKVFWFLLAKLFLCLDWMLKKQYGDIGNTVEVKDILVTAWHVAARKPKECRSDSPALPR